MSLPLPPPTSWPDQIAQAVIGEFNAVITLRDPNARSSARYTPETDTGGTSTPTDVLTGISARVQPFRLPRDVVSQGQWSSRRAFRVQVPLDIDLSALRIGLQIIVTESRDPVLNNMVLEVTNFGNSSHAAVHTIECIANSKQVS